jgi:hypothetical protein
MATPENTFIQGVHRYLPVDLYRMKNHNQFNAGIADVWYSGSAADLWVEYKYITIPKRPDTLITVDLSELQKNWLRSRHAEGRSVGVIVGCKEGGVYFGGVSWGTPVSAEQFRKSVSTRADLATLITLHCNLCQPYSQSKKMR